MINYTALSDDSFGDFIVSGNCQEKQNRKDIEGTNFWKFSLEFLLRFFLKTLPEGIHFLVKLRFKILEFYPFMLLHIFKTFDQKLSSLLRCTEDEVGKLFWNTYDPSSSRRLNRCYILVLMGISWSTLE